MGFRGKLIVFGIIPWILAVVMFVWLLIPAIGDIGKKSGELREKETELNTLVASVEATKDTSKLDKQIAKLQASLRGFNKEYPVKDDLESLYVDVQTALIDTNLTIVKIAVSKDKSIKFPKDFFAEEASEDKADAKDKKKEKKKKKRAKRGKKLPDPVQVIKRSFKLDVSGDYQSAIDLLNYLDSYYRFVTLENIAVKENNKVKLFENLTGDEPGSQRPLLTTIIFSVYNYKEIEMPKEDDKSKKDKKKGK
ncbi:MAG: hypothetical protein AB1782_03930 [Cyanobacteriota bacterium]